MQFYRENLESIDKRREDAQTRLKGAHRPPLLRSHALAEREKRVALGNAKVYAQAPPTGHVSEVDILVRSGSAAKVSHTNFSVSLPYYLIIIIYYHHFIYFFSSLFASIFFVNFRLTCISVTACWGLPGAHPTTHVSIQTRPNCNFFTTDISRTTLAKTLAMYVNDASEPFARAFCSAFLMC